MLAILLVNYLDIMNIIYLWSVICNRNNDLLKLFLSVAAASVSVTIINYFQLNFIMLYISIILIIKVIYRDKLKNILLQFFIILFMEMSFQALISACTGAVIYDENIKMISVELITMLVIIVFAKSGLPKKFCFENVSSDITIFLISTFVMDVIIFKIILLYDDSLILNNLLVTSIIIIIFSVSQVLTYIYIVKSIRENEKLRVENEYKKVIDEIIKDIRQRQHDFNNYKNTIKGIVDVVDEGDLRQTIKNYMKEESVYDTRINELVYINNAIIRAVTYLNMCKAGKHNINFEYRIENNVIDDILGYDEISNLLNNLLNNAFEEVMKDKCIKKNIKIEIFNHLNKHHIIVRNSVADADEININEMMRRGYSTKKTGARGYGLFNVEQIITSHNGIMEIKIEHEEIIFDIYFNSSSG